jgi:hypothetical protein
MMESLIDRVQRVHNKPDSMNDIQTVQEIERLQMVKDQTFSDLKEFVGTRERVHWRTSDKYK